MIKPKNSKSKLSKVLYAILITYYTSLLIAVFTPYSFFYLLAALGTILTTYLFISYRHYNKLATPMLLYLLILQVAASILSVGFDSWAVQEHPYLLIGFNVFLGLYSCFYLLYRFRDIPNNLYELRKVNRR